MTAAPRYRWVVLGVGMLAQGATASVQLGLPAIGPGLRAHYHLSLGETGVVLGSTTWGGTISLLAWGALADRVGERPVIACGMAAAAAALVGAALAPSLGALLVALFLTGILAGSAVAASGRAVVGWFGPAERGMAMGLRHTATPLGAALAAGVLPVALAVSGVRAALALLSAASLVAALAAARWLRDPPRHAGAPDGPRGDVSPLRDRRIWRLAGGSCLIIVVQAGITSFVVVYLSEARGWSDGAAAAALGAILVGGAAGRVAAGRRSDLRGARVGPIMSLAVASAVALGAAVAVLDGPTPLVATLLIVSGVLAMSWNGLSFTATAELAGPGRAGTALGLQNTMLLGMAAFVPSVLGSLVAATSWRVGFAALLAGPAVGLVLLSPLATAERAGRGAD